MSRINRVRVARLGRRAQAIGQAQDGAHQWAVYLETEPSGSALHMLDARGVKLRAVGWTPAQLDAWRAVRQERRQVVARLEC